MSEARTVVDEESRFCELSLEGTVKTYRYVDDDEAAAAQAAANPNGVPAAKKPAAPKKGGE